MTATGAVEPLPCGFNDVVGILMLGNPAEDFRSLAGVGDEARGVAFATITVGDWARLARDLFRGINDFLDGKSLASTEVEPVGFTTLHQVVHGTKVRVGEVIDVDVVANAGSIGCVVVGSKDGEGWAQTLDGLQDNGDEVGFGAVVFTNRAIIGGTRCVEVAQEDTLKTIGAVAVLADAFQHELGAAVGVDGVLLLRLGDGDLGGHAIGRAGGGEDKLFRSGQHHGTKQGQWAGDVVFVILERVNNRFSHFDVGGKVNNRIKLAIQQEGVDDSWVTQVALDKGDFWVNDGLGMPILQGIKHGDFVTLGNELADGVGADVAGSSCDENIHREFWWYLY